MFIIDTIVHLYTRAALAITSCFCYFLGKFELTTLQFLFAGKSTDLQGYEGFVDVSKKVMQGRTAVEQRAAVREVLLSLLPPGAPKTVKFLNLFAP